MVSQPPCEDSDAVVERTKSSIKTQCKYLLEARTFEYMDNALFIRFFEYRLVAGGLFLAEQLPTGNPTDILFKIERFLRADPGTVGLNIKSKLSIGIDNAENVNYLVSFRTKEQYDAVEAINLTSTAEPDLMAHIPIWSVRLRINTLSEIRVNKDQFDKSLILNSYRPLYSLHKLAPFRPEMRPLILRLIQLP